MTVTPLDPLSPDHPFGRQIGPWLEFLRTLRAAQDLPRDQRRTVLMRAGSILIKLIGEFRRMGPSDPMLDGLGGSVGRDTYIRSFEMVLADIQSDLHFLTLAQRYASHPSEPHRNDPIARE